MVEQYDFGDELSRKTVHKLITDILLKYTFHPKLLNKLMDILVQLHNKNCYELSQEICHLISEIREPLISLEPTEDETRDYECKVRPSRFFSGFSFFFPNRVATNNWKHLGAWPVAVSRDFFLN